MEKFTNDLLAQRLPGKYPLPSAVTIFPVTFISAIFCLFIGTVIHLANEDVKYLEICYGTKCCLSPKCSSEIISFCNSEKCFIRFHLKEDWKGPIIATYYKISGFPLNHRKMQASFCKEQLALFDDWRETCHPFRYKVFNTTMIDSEDMGIGDPNSDKFLFTAPMGAKANSMFNDTFSLHFIRPHLSTIEENVLVPFTTDGMLSRLELREYMSPKDKKYQILLKNTIKPRYWRKSIFDLPDGFRNVDFVVWMRKELSQNFRKMYRYIALKGNPRFADGLPAGEYELVVENNWAVHHPHINKAFVLFKPSWYGNYDVYFHKVCWLTGFIFLIVGGIMLIVHKKKGISLEEMAKIEREKVERKVI